MRAMEFTKRKLVLQDNVWRKERLKKRAFEEESVWRSSEAVYQKLTSSECEDWKLQLVKCCYSNAYDCTRNGSLEQQLF